MGRLGERSEIKDAVADEVQRAMERIEAKIEERHPKEVRQPTFAEVAKPRIAFPNLNVRADRGRTLFWFILPEGQRKGHVTPRCKPRAG